MAYFEDNTLVHNITVDADIQALIQKIHDGIAAVGLVQTADTGQIDPSRAVNPRTTLTLIGYEIWRFDDALQATQPVFLKVAYYTGNPSTVFVIRLTVGLGSDGSGTLTTPSTEMTGACANNPSGTGYIYIYFYKGAFGIFSTGYTSGADRLNWLWVERLRDPGGAYINALIVGKSQSTNPYVGTQVMTSGVWASDKPLVHTASTVAGVNGHVCPTRMRLADPQPSSPVRVYAGFRSGIVGSGDTGIIPDVEGDIEYLRLPVTFTMQGYSYVGALTLTNENICLPHEA
jgi:hypothetical protein